MNSWLRSRLIWLSTLLAWSGSNSLLAAEPPPNVVIIFCDDMGWGDVGCNGAQKIRTPAIDSLASQGTRFTSFYVAQPVCSASRAALLTGCYPNRIGIHGALFPNSRVGLGTNEVTLAQSLKARGYVTGMFGKWHLGRPTAFLPTHRGFDEYLGLPYSNDMWPNPAATKPSSYPPLPLIEGDRVIEVMPDQGHLTQRYTERAVQFIHDHHAQPFFLYLAHSMPHVPIFSRPPFAGRSAAGLYGDVIEEIDDSVQQVLTALRDHGLEKNTWVIFSSDNGPWHPYGNHAGSAGPYREGKASVFEGGVRVPCVMRWPGKIPAGRVCTQPLMTIDLFPTIAHQAGASLPAHPIDGRNAWSLISGKAGAKSPQEAYFFYYLEGELQAMRSGRWKLHFPHTALVMNGRPGGVDGRAVAHEKLEVGLELYDLERDPGERQNVASQRPDVIARLQRLAEGARQELGDTHQKRTGKGIRPPALAPQPEPPILKL